MLQYHRTSSSLDIRKKDTNQDIEVARESETDLSAECGEMDVASELLSSEVKDKENNSQQESYISEEESSLGEVIIGVQSNSTKREITPLTQVDKNDITEEEEDPDVPSELILSEENSDDIEEIIAVEADD